MSKEICSINNCDSPVRASKLCYRHYRRKQSGSPIEQPFDNNICSENDCNEVAGRRTGLCKIHYKRNWAASLRKKICTRDGCVAPQVVIGLCAEHSLEERLLGSSRKIGRRWIDKHGYVYIYAPGHPCASSSSGTAQEHRMVMSDYLDRPLFPHENVHHKNGIRDDNRIENLELWSKSQPHGQRVEDKIEWCIKYLAEYGYEVIK